MIQNFRRSAKKMVEEETKLVRIRWMVGRVALLPLAEKHSPERLR